MALKNSEDDFTLIREQLTKLIELREEYEALAALMVGYDPAKFNILTTLPSPTLQRFIKFTRCIGVAVICAQEQVSRQKVNESRLKFFDLFNISKKK